MSVAVVIDVVVAAVTDKHRGGSLETGTDLRIEMGLECGRKEEEGEILP